MTEDQMRKEFYDWAFREGFFLTGATSPHGYVYKETQCAWLAWQACQKLNNSRDAAKVKP